MKIGFKKSFGTIMIIRVLKAVPLMVLLAVLTPLAVLTVSAKGQAVGLEGEEFQGLVESLPEESLEHFPAEAFESEEDFSRALQEMSGFEYILGEIVSVLGIELGGALKLAMGISAILILSSVFSSLSSSLENSALSSAVRFCSSGALFATVLYAECSHLEALESFFSSVTQLMNGMIPVTASVWAMGGNVSTAAVGSSSFYLALAVCNRLFAKTILPIAATMSVLALSDAVSDDMRTGKLLQAIKRIYSLFLTLIMGLLLSTMAAQTSISSAADGAAARTARLVSGSVIPVLGGSVGETLRTVAGGVEYLKSVIGVGGIVLIFLLLLPVGLSVLLARVVLLLTGGLAEILGCQAEARLLENLGEVYGCILAVISGVAVTFVLSLCIFTSTVVAAA